MFYTKRGDGWVCDNKEAERDMDALCYYYLGRAENFTSAQQRCSDLLPQPINNETMEFLCNMMRFANFSFMH